MQYLLHIPLFQYQAKTHLSAIFQRNYYDNLACKKQIFAIYQ